MLTLNELTTKFLHEETMKEFHGKKHKDTKALWVKFCKMSTDKKSFMEIDKWWEKLVQKKVVITYNKCHKPSHWAKNYPMPYEKILQIWAQQINVVEDQSTIMIQTTVTQQKSSAFATVDLEKQILVAEHK